MAPKSGTRHTWPGRPPQPTTDGGHTRGTKIWHHRHTWPNRPPLQPTIEGATRVALKSSTTNTYGQIGPPSPYSPHRRGYTCGTKIWHHKRIWPNRPPPITQIDGVTSVALKSGTTNIWVIMEECAQTQKTLGWM